MKEIQQYMKNNGPWLWIGLFTVGYFLLFLYGMEFAQHILIILSGNANALIAASALGLAIWQGTLQRQHYRLSVKPHLVFHVIVQNDSPQVEITLSNAGIGPAVIKRFLVTIDGEKVEAPIKEIWPEICNRLKIVRTRAGGKVYEIGTGIKSGGEEMIFTLRTTNGLTDPNLDFVNVHKQLERIQIQIEYESMYGDKFIELLQTK